MGEESRSNGIGRMLVIVATVGCVAMLADTSLSAQSIPPDTVSTVFVTDSVPGFGAVGGVAADNLGYVYVADFRNAVWRMSPEGRLEHFADGLYGASGNAVGPRGDLYQSSFHGDYVSRISRDGARTVYADQGLSGPVGIAVDPDGVLFVVNCNGGSVSRIAPGGAVSDFASSELMACPNGITFDDRGDLYVVNFNNTKVLRISPEGEVTEFTDIPGAGGNGHIVFSRGSFYVTKFRGNQVFRVHRDGSFSPLAGTGTAGTGDGAALEATFTRPNGIAVAPGGNVLWINDLTRPVQDPKGPMVSMRRIRLVGLDEVLASVSTDAGVEGVRSAYEAYHDARPGEETSADAVTLGFRWMSNRRVAQGVELLRLNAERHSDDADAQFRLGEAYRYTGRPEQAAEQYRAALELDPDHASANARLAQVTGGG